MKHYGLQAWTDFEDIPLCHPDATAWDIFEENNRDLFDLNTIGSTPQYLRNRLRAAFEAGTKYGQGE